MIWANKFNAFNLIYNIVMLASLQLHENIPVIKHR